MHWIDIIQLNKITFRIHCNRREIAAPKDVNEAYWYSSVFLYTICPYVYLDVDSTVVYGIIMQKNFALKCID